MNLISDTSDRAIEDRNVPHTHPQVIQRNKGNSCMRVERTADQEL